MKRLNLVAYGFERAPEEDFRDDGTSFRCYRYKNFIVSVAHNGDRYFISTSHYQKGNYLPYKVYSKLPCYEEVDYLNGIDRDLVTPISIEALKLSIETYAKAYAEAANK